MSWTPEKDAILRDAVARSIPWSQVQELIPGYSRSGLRWRASQTLKLTRPRPDRAEVVMNVLAAWNGTTLSARSVGELLGMTRCAVIGLVNRNRARVTRPPVECNSRSAATRARKAAERQAAAEAAKVPVDTGGRPAGCPAAVVALERHHCRFPINHPNEPTFHFCQARKLPGGSYCGVHHAVVYDTAKTVVVRRGARKPDFTGGKQHPQWAA